MNFDKVSREAVFCHYAPETYDSSLKLRKLNPTHNGIEYLPAQYRSKKKHRLTGIVTTIISHKQYCDRPSLSWESVYQ